MDLVKLLGANLKFEKLIPLNYTKQDQKNIEKFVSKKDFLIGFGAGAAESAKSRMWPAYKFAELASGLNKKYQNSKILFFGTEDEKPLIRSIINLIEDKHNVINLAGKLSLREVFALVSKCKLFISNDTGLMHIAAAQGVKTIGLFGPNLPVRWQPFGEGNLFIYKGKVCKHSPCINVHKGQVPECRFGDNNKCMRAIHVTDVLKLLK